MSPLYRDVPAADLDQWEEQGCFTLHLQETQEDHFSPERCAFKTSLRRMAVI